MRTLCGGNFSETLDELSPGFRVIRIWPTLYVLHQAHRTVFGASSFVKRLFLSQSEPLLDLVVLGDIGKYSAREPANKSHLNTIDRCKFFLKTLICLTSS